MDSENKINSDQSIALIISIIIGVLMQPLAITIKILIKRIEKKIIPKARDPVKKYIICYETIGLHKKICKI